jgi:hypothetical protein
MYNLKDLQIPLRMMYLLAQSILLYQLVQTIQLLLELYFNIKLILMFLLADLVVVSVVVSFPEADDSVSHSAEEPT